MGPVSEVWAPRSTSVSVTPGASPVVGVSAAGGVPSTAVAVGSASLSSSQATAMSATITRTMVKTQGIREVRMTLPPCVCATQGSGKLFLVQDGRPASLLLHHPLHALYRSRLP